MDKRANTIGIIGTHHQTVILPLLGSVMQASNTIAPSSSSVKAGTESP